MLTIENCPIAIDTAWRGTEDATCIYWISDDNQGSMPGGDLDPSRSVESQMLDFARELLEQGIDTGRISLSDR